MNVTLGFDGKHGYGASLSAMTLAQKSVLSVLVVDDDPEVREEICTRLARRGVGVLAAANGATALRILAGRPDIGALLTDLRMPGMDGLALAQAALAGRGAPDAIEIVLVSGYITPAFSMAAERIGAFGMMSKPLRGARLSAMVEDALDSAGNRRRIALGLAPSPSAPPPPPAPATAAQALLLTLTQRALDGESLALLAQQIRQPLQALLSHAAAEVAQAMEISRVIALVDQVIDLARLESGRVDRGMQRVSAQALATAITARMDECAIRCGRRIILQPDATPAYALNLGRLTDAFGLLAQGAQRGNPARIRAELAVDAGAGAARVDLTLRPDSPQAERGEPAQESALYITIARRLALQAGGRLDIGLLPEGGLRARLTLGGM